MLPLDITFCLLLLLLFDLADISTSVIFFRSFCIRIISEAYKIPREKKLKKSKKKKEEKKQIEFSSSSSQKV